MRDDAEPTQAAAAVTAIRGGPVRGRPPVMRLVTSEEMRALDRATIESGHATGVELMERAGAGVARAIEARYGSVLGLRVLVLAGTGNNGGDGWVVARHLAALGAEVHAGLCGDRSRVAGDARLQLERFESEAGTVPPIPGEEALRKLVAKRDRWDFAVDALLGTGSRGELEGPIATAAEILRELDDAGTRVIAVDLPTGVDADSGEITRRAVRADLTVTFAAPKRGHWLYPGRAFVGALELVDIGLLPRSDDEPGVELATTETIAALLPRREPRTHKGKAGRIIVAGGSPGLTGAVALAARGATRTGAGYVQVAVPASLVDLFEIKLTEEMTIGFVETPRRTLSSQAFGSLLAAASNVHALVLGSGLSRDPESAELVRQVVTEAETPLVIDADGLNAFESRTGSLGRGRGARVLTPHVGEMARLTRMKAEEIEARRIDAPREWAREWNSVVVLKGAPTVTAAPDGRTTVNPTGNPGMATAGMGDVLAGVIAALIAQGLAAYDAARAGVFVHGLAGDLVAATRGPIGLAAGDVADAMPQALAELFRVRDEAAARPAGA